VNATLVDPWGRIDAALLLSVLEPEDPSHWRRIKQIYQYDVAGLAGLQQRREKALQAQVKWQTAP
jgi:hypothetical protein